MLEIINGTKKYGGKTVLNNINYKFEDGKMYGITGPNGSGKTLILKSLAGFIKYTTGQVVQNGKEIRKISCCNRDCSNHFDFRSCGKSCKC